MYDYAKEILTLPENEIELSDRSMEIDVKTQAKEMREIVTALKQTMEKNNIVMLAAPEIGYKRRIFAIKFDTEIKTFINPLMVDVDSIQLARESSLISPGKEFIRPRHSKVTVIYQRPTGQTESRQFIGKAAIYMQQMLDAIDGILDIDIGLEIDKDFDEASDEDKQEIITMYLDSLDLKSKQIEEEAKENQDLKDSIDAVKFMVSVAKGETKLDNGEE